MLWSWWWGRRLSWKHEIQVLWWGGGRWGLMSCSTISDNFFILWNCTGLVWERPAPSTVPAEASPLTSRLLSSSNWASQRWGIIIKTSSISLQNACREGDFWSLIYTTAVKCHRLWQKEALIYMNVIKIKLRSSDFGVKCLQGCITFSVQLRKTKSWGKWVIWSHLNSFWNSVAFRNSSWQSVPLFLAVLAGKTRNEWLGNSIFGITQPSVLSHLATRRTVTRYICLSCLGGERGSI